MKKVKWSFCEHSDVVYDGFSNGVKWNGWDTILVDEATYKKITNMLYCDTSTDDELEDKTYRENNKVDGLYDLCGYTTLIKEVVVMSKNDIISNLSQIEEFLLSDIFYVEEDYIDNDDMIVAIQEAIKFINGGK